MIAFLKGEIVDITDNSLILDVHGVGYEVFVPTQLLKIKEIGQELRLHTYMQVREDAMVLFGFLEKEDLQTFKMLIGVNGIGPKAAISILSTFGKRELYFAILENDAKKIAKTPGIGAKTAQKLILELKDKIKLQESITDVTTKAEKITDSDAAKDAIEALVSLGYSSVEASKAVYAVKGKGEMTAEEILKSALKEIDF